MDMCDLSSRRISINEISVSIGARETPSVRDQHESAFSPFEFDAIIYANLFIRPLSEKCSTLIWRIEQQTRSEINKSSATKGARIQCRCASLRPKQLLARPTRRSCRSYYTFLYQIYCYYYCSLAAQFSFGKQCSEQLKRAKKMKK